MASFMTKNICLPGARVMVGACQERRARVGKFIVLLFRNKRLCDDSLEKLLISCCFSCFRMLGYYRACHITNLTLA